MEEANEVIGDVANNEPTPLRAYRLTIATLLKAPENLFKNVKCKKKAIGFVSSKLQTGLINYKSKRRVHVSTNY